MPLTSARLPARRRTWTARARSATADGEDRDAQRAGLAEEADPAAAGRQRRDRRVEPDRGVGVDDAEAVRPDHPHAVARGPRSTSARSSSRPSAPRSPKPPDSTTSPRTCLRAHSSTTLGDRGGRHRDHGQVHVVRDVQHARGTPGRRRRAAPPGAPGRPAPGSRTPSGCRRRRARPCRGRCWRRSRPPSRGVSSRSIDRDSARRSRSHATARDCVRRRDREAQLDHAGVVRVVGGVAGVGEDPDHPRVLREHLGDEALDAALPGGGGEVLQQQRADAAALLRVVDDEGDLGVPVAVDPVVPADREEVRRRAAPPAPPGRGGRRWSAAVRSRSDSVGCGAK